MFGFGMRYRVKVSFFYILLSLFGGAAGAGSLEFSFAEPYTGRKVSEYQIRLPVALDKQRDWQVPADCEPALAAFEGGAMRWSGPLEKRLWSKLVEDCRYYELASRFSSPQPEDYISDFDFFNAALDALPLTDRSGATGSDGAGAGITSLLGFVEQPSDPFQGMELCRIRNGYFRAWVMTTRDGCLLCEPDPSAPGFRILSVLHTDVDGDGVLDALLRIVPFHPGLSRMPIVLAVTRTEPDAGLVQVPLEP